MEISLDMVDFVTLLQNFFKKNTNQKLNHLNSLSPKESLEPLQPSVPSSLQPVTTEFPLRLLNNFFSGSIVFVEEPTYFLAINIFKNDFRLKVVPVPITPTGIDLEA